MKKTVEDEKAYARRFVPPDADLGQWSHIEPLFVTLDLRGIETTSEMEGWLLDLSELAACIDELRAI